MYSSILVCWSYSYHFGNRHYFIHDDHVDAGNRVIIVSIDNPWDLIQDKVEKVLVEYILIFSDELVCRALLAVLDSGIRPWAQVCKLRLQNSKDFLGRLSFWL